VRLGIELDAGVIRAVRVQGGRGSTVQVAETAWDPEKPEEAVQAIRESLGSAAHVAVAIGLPLLLIKRVKLPPVPALDRAAILQLEPQRFFAVRLEDLVASVRDEDDLVFAAREAPLTQWLTALQALGPVHRVEPSPLALARALVESRVSDAVVLLDGSDRRTGVGLVEIRAGRVTNVRRLYGELPEAEVTLRGNGEPPPRTVAVTPWDDVRAGALAARLPSTTVEPLAAAGDVPAQFLTAYGAALGTDRPLVGALMPDQLRAGIKRRRRRALWFAALTAVAAAIFALTSVAAWRGRSAREIDTKIRALSGRATDALALQSQLVTLNRQAGGIARVAIERADPLAVLLALSKQLPAGAYLRSMRASGGEWQVDGYAKQAAQLIQVLGTAAEFRGVHFLSATNRVQVGERSYESFSLAFRFVPTP
jgi:type IV pilus assembly PilN-like protein